MLNKWLLIFFVFSFSQTLIAESDFRVFQTQQPGQNLIPQIAPLYGNSAHFSAKNNMLIIRAAPAVLQEIEQLLQQIDTPLHNLLIEVKSSLSGNSDFQHDSISGTIKLSDSTAISIPAANKNISSDRTGTTIRTIHTRRNRSKDEPDLFKIRTLEGQWAAVNVGKKVPYYNNNAYPYDNRLSGGVELVDVQSGFDVYPVLIGNQVNLKIRPYNSSMNREYSKRIDTRSIETTVTGDIGQWIELGGAINRVNEQLDGINYSTNRYSELDSNYSIRVSIIN